MAVTVIGETGQGTVLEGGNEPGARRRSVMREDRLQDVAQVGEAHRGGSLHEAIALIGQGRRRLGGTGAIVIGRWIVETKTRAVTATGEIEIAPGIGISTAETTGVMTGKLISLLLGPEADDL